ncbi:MAG: Trehalose utilization [Lentisphaerae bacterium ADurb.Bin242]|nr:MAG: Trehalose utilization [Lentisphaerae bacterium ADurb.Bin242]
MKKILLAGGGEFHDFAGCCAVIGKHLTEMEGYRVETVLGDLDCLKRSRMDAFDIAVFYWTKDRLSPEQKHGLLDWCAEKGRFVGIHCASTAFRDCPEYEAMLGGRFRKHPPYRKYTVTLDMSHPAMKHFASFEAPGNWDRWNLHEADVTDEQFLNDYDPRVHVAARAYFRNEAWPVAWSKSWGSGKVYYLALGHDVAACDSEFFKQMLFAGVKWVDSPEPEPCDLSRFNLI